MVFAVDPNAEVDYVLEEDRGLPVNEQTSFRLKCLTARQMAKVEDMMGVVRASSFRAMREESDEELSFAMNTGTQALKICEMGLVGWNNFKFSNGEEVYFEKLGDKALDYLSVDIRTEIANAITNLSTLEEQDVKN